MPIQSPRPHPPEFEIDTFPIVMLQVAQFMHMEDLEALLQGDDDLARVAQYVLAVRVSARTKTMLSSLVVRQRMTLNVEENDFWMEHTFRKASYRRNKTFSAFCKVVSMRKCPTISERNGYSLWVAKDGKFVMCSDINPTKQESYGKLEKFWICGERSRVHKALKCIRETMQVSSN